MEEEENLHERLNLQLSELEILRSMFIDEKELSVDQDSLLAIQDYISGINTALSGRLGFSLFLAANDLLLADKTTSSGSSSSDDVLEVNCCLPHSYPEEHPEVYVKCNSLSREGQKELNDKTQTFLETLETGELCIVTVIQWLQENWATFCEKSQQPEKDTKIMASNIELKVNLSRLWLYMHHIYNKSKRKYILEWAGDHNLTGFSLPGKPGVVCIEGDLQDAEGYFGKLRQLNWKRITCRHRETELSERKFDDFNELVFRVHGAGDDRMSMGEFFQYLVKHELGHMFKILFGIEGK